MGNAQAQVLHSSSRVWAAALEGQHGRQKLWEHEICTTEGKSSKREVSWESWDTSAWMGRRDTGLQECCDLAEVFRAEEAALAGAGSFHFVIQQPRRHPEPRDPTPKLSWVRDGSPQQQLNLLCCCGQGFSHSPTLRLGLGRTPWKAWIGSAPAWGTPKVPVGNKVFFFPATGESLNQGCECR